MIISIEFALGYGRSTNITEYKSTIIITAVIHTLAYNLACKSVVEKGREILLLYIMQDEPLI